MEEVGAVVVLEVTVADLEEEVAVLEDLAEEAGLLAVAVPAAVGKEILICFSLKLFGGFCKIDMKLNTFIQITSLQ